MNRDKCLVLMCAFYCGVFFWQTATAFFDARVIVAIIGGLCAIFNGGMAYYGMRYKVGEKVQCGE